MFEPGTYPELPDIDRTFSGSLTLDLQGDGSVELIELDRPGVSTTQTVVRVNGDDLIVGDLAAVETHAWLEGGIRDGQPDPDVDAWVAALDELPALATGRLLPGRGEPQPIPDVVEAQTA